MKQMVSPQNKWLCSFYLGKFDLIWCGKYKHDSPDPLPKKKTVQTIMGFLIGPKRGDPEHLLVQSL